MFGGFTPFTCLLQDQHCYTEAMEKPVYDEIGIDYNANRRADCRITKTIAELLALPAGACIADIGAGTGNYSNALAELGFRVIAVEPSAVMREQTTCHSGVRWLAGTAEAVPLENSSVDGVIVILAIHHFGSLSAAATEFYRICPRGPIVVLTYDPRKGRGFWFNNYFPEIYENEFKRFPPAEDVAARLARHHWRVIIHDFPLPADLQDRNMHAAWNRPELYLDELARRNTSGFALASQADTERRLAVLQRDLASGEWDRKYGHLRNEAELSTGFVFLKLSDQ